MEKYTVSAKYSCGFSNLLDSSIIVDERYLDYFTTIMEDRLWQLLAKPVPSLVPDTIKFHIGA